MRKLLAAVLPLLLVGCSTTEATEPPPPDVVEGEALVKAWGDELTLGGFVVKVERPEEYKAGYTDDVPAGYDTMLVPMAATNTGTEPLAAYWLYVGGVSGGEDVVSYVEYADSGYGPPDAMVLPGKSVEWEQPVAVADPDDITLQIDYGEGTLNIEATAFIGDDA